MSTKKPRPLSEARLQGERVLLRAGFDVPIENGKVVDSSRIQAMVPTMKHILDGGGALIIMAHQGRPKANRIPEMSQKPLIPILEKLLNRTVKFAEACTGPDAQKKAAELQAGEVLLLENLRYEQGEKENVNEEFGKQLASLADLYVNDAFTNCHRPHASMVEVPKHLPSFMGLQLEQEIQHLSEVLHHPKHPLVLIVSGAKMETKVPVIKRFLDRGDDVLLGGCIANTFVAARGFDVGESKYEEEFLDTAKEIMMESEKENNALVHVPRDAVVASEAKDHADKVDLPIEDVEGDMKIFDIGKVTIDRYVKAIEKASMVVWNGPLGLYEFNCFSHATKRIAEAVRGATERGATTIVGGGDTIDFHIRYAYPLDCYTFVSTGGGAMLEYIAGKKLPAIEALKR